jgi:hypothetical protein
MMFGSAKFAWAKVTDATLVGLQRNAVAIMSM